MPTDARPSAARAAVTVIVHGTGRVVSAPPGIDCADACAAYFDVGTTVSLSAVAGQDWQLRSFQGACSGAECSLVVDGDRVVEAAFEAQPGTGWFRPIGNDADEEVQGTVLVDGDIVAVGEFRGDIDLGAGPIESGAPVAIFIARYDAMGTLKWATTIDGPALRDGSPVAATPDGDLLITGLFGNTTDFGGQALTSAGRSDFFVAKFSGATGALLWVNGAGGTEIDRGRAVAADSAGNALVAGEYRRNIDFGDGVIEGAYNGSLFVAKYAAADGALVWYAVDFADNFKAEARAIAADAAGNAIVGGLWQNTGSEAEFSDGFVSKYGAADGARAWRFELDDRAASMVSGVAGSGTDVFVAGSYRGTVDVDGIEYTSGASDDVFVARLSAEGAPRWFASHASDGYDFATDLVLRPDGNVSVCGGFSERLNFGAEAFVTSAGGIDALHAIFDDNGGFVAAESFGGVADDRAQAMAVDANQRVFTGTFGGVIDVGGTAYQARGPVDGFVYVKEERP